MLGRIAFGAALLALSVPSFGQRRSGGGASYPSASFDAEMAEPSDDDAGPDFDEDVPADLSSDSADDEPSVDAPRGSAQASAEPDSAPAAAAPSRAADAPRAAAADEPTPTSRDAAVARVADACHVESGLFCDAVRLDDLKTARCLLRYRDDMLPDCARALGAAEPYLKP